VEFEDRVEVVVVVSLEDGVEVVESVGVVELLEVVVVVSLEEGLEVVELSGVGTGAAWAALRETWVGEGVADGPQAWGGRGLRRPVDSTTTFTTSVAAGSLKTRIPSPRTSVVGKLASATTRKRLTLFYDHEKIIRN
jgi:CO dehydrogenase/acetyl-CoA synthase delta subunit